MFDSNIETFLRFALATLLGAIIGVNQAAGLRTHAIVGLGAAIVTSIVGSDAGMNAPFHFDAMSRVIQSVITGIGFLGAGVILRTENGQACMA